MIDLTEEQKKALDEFKQISDVLTVPTPGKSLPEHRQWTLPCPDKKALADHPQAATDEKVKKCLSSGTSLLEIGQSQKKT